ncbi:Uncharacterised protein [Candidatus Bilamarchaeum dharawalense]|uniref:Uncharacterized protein n=1 Tax=Candidatus Bilamarchaeum dharawalense TaxID=2885759 RepID=A0A5E4LRT3_9ARCH|nr:Uncharacterised protein [Candidatus Bilamarchaeum dharawalense]
MTESLADRLKKIGLQGKAPVTPVVPAAARVAEKGLTDGLPGGPVPKPEAAPKVVAPVEPEAAPKVVAPVEPEAAPKVVAPVEDILAGFSASSTPSSAPVDIPEPGEVSTRDVVAAVEPPKQSAPAPVEAPKSVAEEKPPLDIDALVAAALAKQRPEFVAGVLQELRQTVIDPFMAGVRNSITSLVDAIEGKVPTEAEPNPAQGLRARLDQLESDVDRAFGTGAESAGIVRAMTVMQVSHYVLGELTANLPKDPKVAGTRADNGLDFGPVVDIARKSGVETTKGILADMTVSANVVAMISAEENTNPTALALPENAALKAQIELRTAVVVARANACLSQINWESVRPVGEA